MGDFPRVILDGGDGQPFGEDLPVLAAIPDFALPGASLRDGFIHRRIKTGVVTPGTEQAGSFANGLVDRVAGNFGKSLIGAQDDALVVGDEHAFLRLEGRGGNAQIILDALAFGNVGRYAAQCVDVAVFPA